jgi:hypothetical protein
MKDGRSRYGPLFAVGLLAGWTAIAFGVVSVSSHAGAVPPLVFAVWVIGLALAHDLVLVPLTDTIGRAADRWIPGRARGPVVGALVASGTIVLCAIPQLLGSSSGNPSLLPRNTLAGIALVLAIVWTVAMVIAVRRSRARGGDR